VWEGLAPDEAHAGNENYKPSNSAIKSLSRSTFSALIAVAASPSMYSANCATVLHSNIARNGTSLCKVFCTREAICVASNECAVGGQRLRIQAQRRDAVATSAAGDKPSGRAHRSATPT